VLKISAVMITFNAQANLRQVLSSLGFASEIVVVDGGSTDRTVEICREFGARVFTKAWSGYGAQKNYAIEQARHPWVLSIDADEVVSPELAREITALEESTPYAGFRIPRLNHYFTRPLYHGGQYPDLQLRLFRAGRGHYNMRPIHESVELDGSVGLLSGKILHYSYDTITDYFEKFARYTSLEAERLAAAGERPAAIRLALRIFLTPCWKFLWRYLFKLGFLDGTAGLLAALFNSFTMIVSYAKFWEIARENPPGAKRPDRRPGAHHSGDNRSGRKPSSVQD
jgi:glycosyltransferase involved in cell wall biosynthesis